MAASEALSYATFHFQAQFTAFLGDQDFALGIFQAFRRDQPYGKEAIPMQGPCIADKGAGKVYGVFFRITHQLL